MTTQGRITTQPNAQLLVPIPVACCGEMEVINSSRPICDSQALVMLRCEECETDWSLTAFLRNEGDVERDAAAEARRQRRLQQRRAT